MILFDSLRLPSPFDPSASAYKDWLHMNILHHPTGSVGLINVSLHGPPNDPRSRAIGTALMHIPEIGWVGNVEVCGFTEAAIDPLGIGLERTALAVRYQPGAILASVADPDNGVTIRLTATPCVDPVIVENRIPLGRGWISWYAVPRLALTGQCTAAHQRLQLQDASAYYDHNWGRWHWGDDMGWEWGCFLTRAPGMAFVLSRPTDRGHRHSGMASFVAICAQRRCSFAGAAVELDADGAMEALSRRIPGAVAALRQDRAHPQVPKHLRIRADNGIDRVTVEFTGRSAVQVIAADPVRKGYGFIHEIAGEFAFSATLGGIETSGAGLGMIEYVD